MERRKPRVITDELAVVKAAAWAWYQHGSGSEGKPMREFDLTRTHRSPRPSRFKLEATRRAENTMKGSQSLSSIPSPTHTDNSLFDSYEIERISKQLDNLIESCGGNLPHESHARDGDRRKNASLPESGKKVSKRWNMSWRRHAVLCGSREDVMEAIVLGGRQRPKHGSVVRLDNRHPKANNAK